MKNKIDRRQFVQSTAALGAGLFVAPNVLGAAAGAAKKDPINVAIIGAGAEGDALFNAITKIKNSGVNIKAVCDIWGFNRNRFASTLGKYKKARKYAGYDNRAYKDYQEMLDKEKDKIDAVIVATPDCFHAEHTNACLDAGLHVYCEKEMSNTIAGAKSMVLKARETGKLLQIGHQRRSNPKYRFAKKNFIDRTFPIEIEDLQAKITTTDKKIPKVTFDSTLLGQITTINGQWNRGAKACKDLGWPKGSDIPLAELKKYGFKDMSQFRNWRWYKDFGGGPIVDLGSHQIDIFSWFLGEAKPKSVMASGGIDYWKNHEWYDNVMAVFEFDTKAGPVRAFYQTLTTSGSGGYYEKFMGINGTLEISEDPKFFKAGRQPKLLHDKTWEPWIEAGLITKDPKPDKKSAIVDVRSSPPLYPYTPKLDYDAKMPYHSYHLANFFDAIRDKNVKLNCPAEVGYHTAVMVLKVNEAVKEGKTLEFKPEDFEV